MSAKTGGGRDLHVVERVLQGDAEVYRILIERYRSELLAHAFVQVGSIDVAEEVVDDAFLAAFNTLADIPNRADFRTFVFGHLTRRLVLRAQSATRMGELDVDDRAALVRARSQGFDEAASAALLRVLLRLSADVREAWSLVYIAGLNEEDAARVSGVSVETLRERIDRARKSIESAATMSENETQNMEALDSFLPLPTLPELSNNPGGES